MGGDGSAKVHQRVADLAAPIEQTGRIDFERGLPAFQQGGQDALEILQGLIPESLRPSILAGIEAGRSAASRTTSGNVEDLVRRGITGTEFAQSNAASILAGESDVADIPSQFTQPIFDQTIAEILGLPISGVQQIGDAVSVLSGGSIGGRTSGGASGAVAGGLNGAVSGASTGSTFGAYGAAIGAVVGAGVGGYTGSK